MCPAEQLEKELRKNPSSLPTAPKPLQTQLLHSSPCCHLQIPHSHCRPKQYRDRLPWPTTQYQKMLNKMHFDQQGDAVPYYVTIYAHGHGACATFQLLALEFRLLWQWFHLSYHLPSTSTRARRIHSSIDFMFFHECVPKWFKWVLQNFGVDYLYISPDKVGHVEIHLPVVCLPSRLDKGSRSW